MLETTSKGKTAQEGEQDQGVHSRLEGEEGKRGKVEEDKRWRGRGQDGVMDRGGRGGGDEQGR